MGLTSDRGSQGGARRRRDSRRDNGDTASGAAPLGRTGLVGGGWTDYDRVGYRQAADGRTRASTHGRSGVPAGLVDGERDRRHPARVRRAAGRRRSVAGWLGRFPVPVLSVVAIIACAAVVAAGIGVSRMLTAQSVADAAPDPNCTLIVPANPLTAQGLATPYQLTATNPAAGPCDEVNPNQTAFVQGAVIDPATGKISVYDPLVINAGTQPATAPVVPALPAGGIVAVWFGFNGKTLTLAGADQGLTAAPSAAPSASQSGSAAPSATPSVTGSPSVSPSGAASASATAPASAASSATPSAMPSGSVMPTSAASVSASAPATPTSAATPTATPVATATASAPATSTAPAATAAALGPARAAAESVGSAPLSPRSGGTAGWFDARLTQISGAATPSAGAPSTGTPSAKTTSTSGHRGRSRRHHRYHAAPSPSGSAVPTPSMAAPPPPNPADSPAASPVKDAILQQANCIAGEDFGTTFSSFTQVGACNAVAFFQAANAAIKAGKLTVPAPGTAKDGKACLTTRSFALIDQDQSDNVTTEYLVQGNGQVAQDTAANRAARTVTATLVNGSDNGLLDLFVDPALGCSPWMAPNLADNGAPAPALPLDELQAAAWAGRQGGGPAALVPLNDPMTLSPGGQFSIDKTDTYRSIMNIQPLPAGESPTAYCSDMERIQGARLQQDVNLLTGAPTPAPNAADNLFTFLAMRLQQSFTNLNCGSFGMTNDVSTTVDGNGVVVAACFVHQVAPLTAGPGNPTAGKTVCPATVGGPAPASSPSPSPTQHHRRGYGDGYANAEPTGAAASAARDYYHHHHHG